MDSLISMLIPSRNNTMIRQKASNSSMLPGSRIILAAGGGFEVYGGGVSAILQHVIWKICKELVELQNKTKVKAMSPHNQG